MTFSKRCCSPVLVGFSGIREAAIHPHWLFLVGLMLLSANRHVCKYGKQWQWGQISPRPELSRFMFGAFNQLIRILRVCPVIACVCQLLVICSVQVDQVLVAKLM